MRDANIAEPSKAVVQSIEFHPDGQVLMTAGMDKRLRFFQVSHLLGTALTASARVWH